MFDALFSRNKRLLQWFILEMGLFKYDDLKLLFNLKISGSFIPKITFAQRRLPRFLRLSTWLDYFCQNLIFHS